MDTFIDEAGPQESVPRTDPSSNPFRDEPDLLSFGEPTRTREPTPSPTLPYRPPTDTLRSPTPSPGAVAAVRDTQRDATNVYGRADAAGRVAVVPESADRSGYSVDVRALPYENRNLDDADRRDLARLRAAEQHRINDSPERTYALSDIRARGSVGQVTSGVRKALDMLKIDPEKEPSRDDLKAITKAAEHAVGTTRIQPLIQPLTSIEDVLAVMHSLTGAFAGVVHGDKYAMVVSFALCDPQPSRRGLMVTAAAPVDVITAMQYIVLPDVVQYEIQQCAEACDLKYELSSAKCAHVVECCPVFSAIDAASCGVGHTTNGDEGSSTGPRRTYLVHRVLSSSLVHAAQHVAGSCNAGEQGYWRAAKPEGDSRHNLCVHRYRSDA